MSFHVRRNEIDKKIAEEIKVLESRSKPLHELVTTENFFIDEVVAESYPTSFTPVSERIFGGKSPVYRGGFASKLVLKVRPCNEIPVRTLDFDGFSPVISGNYISAKIPKYEEKRVGYGLEKDKVFYIDRDFKPREHAIELSILSGDGFVLRRDRAVDYKRFLKE